MAYQWHHGTDKLYSIVKIWYGMFEWKSDSHVGLVEDTKNKEEGSVWIKFIFAKIKNTIAK